MSVPTPLGTTDVRNLWTSYLDSYFDLYGKWVSRQLYQNKICCGCHEYSLRKSGGQVINFSAKKSNGHGVCHGQDKLPVYERASLLVCNRTQFFCGQNIYLINVLNITTRTL